VPNFIDRKMENPAWNIVFLLGYAAAFIGLSRLAFWVFPWLTLDRAAVVLLAFGLGWAWGTRHKWWWSSQHR
jgi:hypothetical protein